MQAVQMLTNLAKTRSESIISPDRIVKVRTSVYLLEKIECAYSF